MNVQALMSVDPKTCLVTDMLHAAARVLWDHDCGCVPVVDPEGKLVGLVTDRDVCMAAYTQGMPLHMIPVERVMARELFTVTANTSAKAVAHMLAEKRVRRLPVVDAAGKLLGIVSVADLVVAAFGDERKDGRRPKAKLVHAALVSVSKPRAAEVTAVVEAALEAPIQAQLESRADVLVPAPRRKRVNPKPKLASTQKRGQKSAPKSAKKVVTPKRKR